MAIPVISPYPIPEAARYPANRVPWRADPARAVLLVHDMQKYFLRPYPRGAEPYETMIANCAALVGACRRLEVPVIHTAQPGTQSARHRGLLTDFWGPGLIDQLDDTAIAEEVAPDVDGIVLNKWRYSAFIRSDLERRLQRFGRDQLIVCGVYAHIGISATALDAFSRDFQVLVAADAVADFTEGEHRAALAWLAGCCAAVTDTRTLTADLGALTEERV